MIPWDRWIVLLAARKEHPLPEELGNPRALHIAHLKSLASLNIQSVLFCVMDEYRCCTGFRRRLCKLRELLRHFLQVRRILAVCREVNRIDKDDLGFILG